MQFYRLLQKAAEGKALKADYDSLSAWYVQSQNRIAFAGELIQKLRLENTALIARNDTLRTRIIEKNALLHSNGVALFNEQLRKRKAFGIGVNAGYNPFTRGPAVSVGLQWNIVRFSLRGVNNGKGYEAAKFETFGGGAGGGAGAKGSY